MAAVLAGCCAYRCPHMHVCGSMRSFPHAHLTRKYYHKTSLALLPRRQCITGPGKRVRHGSILRCAAARLRHSTVCVQLVQRTWQPGGPPVCQSEQVIIPQRSAAVLQPPTCPYLHSSAIQAPGPQRAANTHDRCTMMHAAQHRSHCSHFSHQAQHCWPLAATSPQLPPGSTTGPPRSPAQGCSEMEATSL
jgi:hypothetical protein